MKRLNKEKVLVFLFPLFLIFISSCAGQKNSIKKPSLPGSLSANKFSTDLVDQAISKVNPALVRIHVVTVEYYGGREIKRESSGSGVIISKEGHVITNHHVAGKAKQITCTLSNKEELNAVLIGSDPLADIAVLKLESREQREFPTAKFGDSSSVKVGDPCLAMGSPLALSQSVTSGIISNMEMVMPELFWPFDKFNLDGEDVGTIIRWIGHDAAIYGGNSGGPLVNLNGEVIGINEIGFGLSGAIPGNIAKEVAESLIASGEVERSWIGLVVQPLLKTSSVKNGVLISGTIENSPAETAGLQAGDILIKIANQEVAVKSSEELPLFNQLITKLPIGEKTPAIILRDNEKLNLTVTPIKRENSQPKTIEFKNWGMTGSSISLIMAKEMKRKYQDGVIVKNTRPGGPCGEAKPSIQSDDIITGVNDLPVKNTSDLLKITYDISQTQTKPVPAKVSFERKTEQYLTVVNIGVQKLEDPGREAQKAWLSVSFQVLTKNIAKALGIENRSGIRITQVYANGSAEKAGLLTGDIITHIDDTPITINQPEDTETFRALIRQYKIGSKVKLHVLRYTDTLRLEEIDLEVELETSPKLDREMKKYRDDNFEFTARDITFFDKDKEKWEEKHQGTLIVAVDEGGWSALAHLAVNDLLLSVDGEAVPDIAKLRATMEKIASDKPGQVVFKILRGIYYRFIEIKPDWKQLAEAGK